MQSDQRKRYPVTRPDHTSAPTALPAILLAVQGFDTGRILDVLDVEAEHHGLDAVVDDVIFPALRTVGTYWAHGSFSVAHEHLFTAAATRWLYFRLAVLPVPTSGPGVGDRRPQPVVLAAGPEDLHIIGLDCLELLLTARGVQTRNLAGRVPTDALVATAVAVDAAAVVICSHAAPDATSASVATDTLRAAHAAGLAVYYAGSSFDSPFVQRRVPGTALDHSVAASADQLARLVEGPRTDGTGTALTRPVRQAR